jgi:hypothetical protein
MAITSDISFSSPIIQASPSRRLSDVLSTRDFVPSLHITGDYAPSSRRNIALFNASALAANVKDDQGSRLIGRLPTLPIPFSAQCPPTQVPCPPYHHKLTAFTQTIDRSGILRGQTQILHRVLHTSSPSSSPRGSIVTDQISNRVWMAQRREAHAFSLLRLTRYEDRLCRGLIWAISCAAASHIALSSSHSGSPTLSR